jgi:hypothetical protein
MKRPQLIHFLAIKTNEYIAIKASLTMGDVREKSKQSEFSLTPRFPIQASRLLGSNNFKIKIVGLNNKQQEIFSKSFSSDSFGGLHFKIPLNNETNGIEVIQVYETSQYEGVHLHLGTYIPQSIINPKKIIICDFDKTLVDTRYSTTKELYKSLTSPLESFPTLELSVVKLKEHIANGFHPFILTASPHFYEEAIRDWLFQNQIYTAGIFLKDYREVFSFTEGNLRPKDLKVQGLYKLNHLLDILLMIGIPKELALMGDNFEADPIIYLTMAHILTEESDPWRLWNTVKEQESFKLSSKQNSQLLNKMYQFKSLIKNNKDSFADNEDSKTSVKIYIRKIADENDVKVPIPILKDKIDLIELYKGTNKYSGPPPSA